MNHHHSYSNRNFHRSQSWSGNKEYFSPEAAPFKITIPAACTNKYGLVTSAGVENIDPFLLTLRFYGFDLWMDRYAETGKRYLKRTTLTKLMYYSAVVLINVQILVHIMTLIVSNPKNKTFFNSLDDLRTFIVKVTMTFAINFWFVKSRQQASMTHLVVINYLRANSSRKLRRLANIWMFVLIFCTVLHWAISQYWLSSMSFADHRKWIKIIQYASSASWVDTTQDNIWTVELLRILATIDSFVYRMYTYGGRFASMCTYCLLLMLLKQCVRQVNLILVNHLDSEYHYHHHYCKRGRTNLYNPANSNFQFSQYDIRFNFELFKDQFRIVYGMHQEIEHCFGLLNFIWFGSLFVVSCIDIFFLAWNAGTEWFRVWSLLEFTSMLILWIPHFFVAYFASLVSLESRQMKLHLKELCRQDEEVRDIIVSSIFYPRIKPTLYGIVALDISFLLSFICTLVTFSVMMIQLNPQAVARIG